jgi:hypothetical protein
VAAALLRIRSQRSDLNFWGGGSAGYITINGTYEDGTHLFFWMFESRSKPATDPLIVWLTGGTLPPPLCVISPAFAA